MFWKIFEIHLSIKFRENPSIGNGIIDTER